jgi:site-specific DNA-cytosine methylase
MAIDKYKNLTAIEFFYGAGAIYYGLGQSGIQFLAGIDNETECQTTHGDSIHSFARQIGKAVPPELSRRVGMHIKQIHQNG